MLQNSYGTRGVFVHQRNYARMDAIDLRSGVHQSTEHVWNSVVDINCVAVIATEFKLVLDVVHVVIVNPLVEFEFFFHLLRCEDAPIVVSHTEFIFVDVVSCFYHW